jgi:hypothetical protein
MNMPQLNLSIELRITNKYGTLGLKFFKESAASSRVQFGQEQSLILEELMN